MLGKLCVALLIVAAPAVANEPLTTPAAQVAQAPAPQEFTTKKVCHTVEVAGSFIPRTSCVNKKVPVKTKAPGETLEAKAQSGSSDGAAKE